MGKQDRAIQRALGMAGNPKEQIKFIKDGFFGKTWYFTKFGEKLIFILSLIALFYSIARIIVQGFW